jgi:hypothetical protein
MNAAVWFNLDEPLSMLLSKKVITNKKTSPEWPLIDRGLLHPSGVNCLLGEW